MGVKGWPSLMPRGGVLIGARDGEYAFVFADSADALHGQRQSRWREANAQGKSRMTGEIERNAPYALSGPLEGRLVIHPTRRRGDDRGREQVARGE